VDTTRPAACGRVRSTAALVLTAILMCAPLLTALSAAADTTPSRTATARPGTRISVSSTSVIPRAPLKITGKVPAISWRRVVLQTVKAGVWRKVSATTTSRRGRFVFRFEAPGAPGRARYRVYAPRKRVYEGTMRAVATRTVLVWIIDPRGSRTNPYSLGEAFTVGDWVVELASTDYDAWLEMDHDIADAPDPGWNYVSNYATYTYWGPDSSSPYFDLSTDFLAADNRTYNRSSGGQWCAGVDPDVIDVSDMFAGATASAHDCAVVPTDLAHDGLWRVRGDDAEVFVRAD
jgi:hypothetical protein